MSWYRTLKTTYPSSIPLKEYLKTLKTVLGNMGFLEDNTILCLSTCRDENTRPLTQALHDDWGETFNLSGLGGLLFCGRASLKAAINHAPVDEFGVERYLFIGMTHIGISEEGEVGKFVRTNRPGKSGACGALEAIRGEIENGEVPLEINQLDMEMSLLRQKIISHLKFGSVPSLVDLTEVAREIIEEDLELLTDRTVESEEYGTCMMLDCEYYEASEETLSCLMLQKEESNGFSGTNNDAGGYMGSYSELPSSSDESVSQKGGVGGSGDDDNTNLIAPLRSVLTSSNEGGGEIVIKDEFVEDVPSPMEFGTCMMLGCKVGIDLKFKKVQYAYQSGIQIHGPENETWIVPGDLWVNTGLAEGKKKVDVNYIIEWANMNIR